MSPTVRLGVAKLTGNTRALMETNNPVLGAKQQAFETDTGRMKIGDGTTAWNALPYEFESIPTTTRGAGTYVLKPSDASSRLKFTGTATVKVPPSVIPANNVVLIVQAGAGAVTVEAEGGMTVQTPASRETRARYSTIALFAEGPNEATLSGDLQ